MFTKKRDFYLQSIIKIKFFVTFATIRKFLLYFCEFIDGKLYLRQRIHLPHHRCCCCCDDDADGCELMLLADVWWRSAASAAVP